MTFLWTRANCVHTQVEASEDSGLLAGLQANGVTAGQDTISVAFVSICSFMHQIELYTRRETPARCIIMPSRTYQSVCCCVAVD